MNIDIKFIIAQIFGVFALICLMLSFRKNRKKYLLKLQMLSSLFYALQFLLLGGISGFFINIICIFRNYILYKNSKIDFVYLFMLLLVMLICTLFSYNGVISLVPFIATSIYSISLWINKLKIIRLGNICATIILIIYEICIGAYSGVLATSGELLSSLYAFIKFNLKKD